MGDAMEGKALVLFSGGQDSATCLAWALERYAHVETIGFHYGQRHAVELECRKVVLDRLREDFPAWGDRHFLSPGRAPPRRPAAGGARRSAFW